MVPMVEIQSGFVGSFFYFGLKVSSLIQGAFAKLFWWIFLIPGLWLAKFLNAEKLVPIDQRRSTSPTFVVLDTLKVSHGLLWRYLKSVFQINALISGVANRYSLFESLLGWNPKVPIIGFVEDKTTFTIELLFKYSEDGKSRGCDFTQSGCPATRRRRSPETHTPAPSSPAGTSSHTHPNCG